MAAPKQQLNETIVGMLVSGGIIALLAFIILVGNLNIGKKGYEVTVKYKRINNLKTDAQVRLAGGKKIGRVTAIDVGDDGRLHIKLQIDRDIRLYKGMKFRQSTLGLMGDTYIDVGLISGTENLVPLENGAVIDGVEPFGMEMLSDQGADTQQLVNNAVDVINNMVQVSADIRTIVADSRDNLTSTMYNLRNTTYKVGEAIDPVKLKAAIENLNDVAANLKNITGQIRSRQGSLGKLIYDDTAYNKLIVVLDSATAAMNRIREQGVLGRERTQ